MKLSLGLRLRYDWEILPVLIRKPDLFRQDYYYREYEHPNKLYKMAICSTEKEIAADIDMELKL